MGSRKNILAALAGIGAIAAANTLMKPSRTQSLASDMRNQLDSYNFNMSPGQDRRASLLDRTAMMKSEKKRKPWNMTAAERQTFERKE